MEGNKSGENILSLTLTDEQKSRCQRMLHLMQNGTYSDYLGGHLMELWNNPPTTKEQIVNLSSEGPFGGYLDHHFQELERIDPILAYTGGSLPEANQLLDELRVEFPHAIEDSFIEQVSNGMKIVVTRATKDIVVDARGVVSVVNRAIDMSKELGIDTPMGEYLTLVSKQVPVSFSVFDEVEKVASIGAQGFDNYESPVLGKVLAHEYGHAQLSQALKQKEQVGLGRLTDGSPMYGVFSFFDEGVAEYMGMKVGEEDPRHEMNKLWKNMYSKVVDDLFEGKLKDRYDDGSFEEWLENNEGDAYVGSIHTRVLPATIVQYITEKKEIKLLSVFRQMLIANDKARQAISDELGVEKDEVPLDLGFLGAKFGDVAKNEDVGRYKELARLRPFELLGQITGVDERVETKNFLEWLEAGEND